MFKFKKIKSKAVQDSIVEVYNKKADKNVNELNRQMKRQKYIGEQSATLEEYTTILTILDMKQNVNLFGIKVDGLDIPHWLIPLTLYQKSLLAFFKNSVGELVFTPVTIVKWQYNQLPLIVTPLPMYSNHTIDTARQMVVGVDCVLLYDGSPWFIAGKPFTRHAYNQPLIKQMAKIFGKLNVNITFAGDKAVFQVDNDVMAEELEEFLEYSYNNSKSFIVTTKPLLAQPNSITTTVNFDELTSLLKEMDLFRQMSNGIGSGGYGVHKKERLITAEATQDEQSVDLITVDREECLKTFQKEMQEVFGIGVKYDRRTIETNDGTEQQDAVGTDDTDDTTATTSE